MFFQGGVDVHSDYGVSLMNPDVYHILNERFNFPLIRLTMEGYEKLPYYPVVVDVHKAKEMPLYKRMLRVKKMNQEALVNG